MQGWRILPTADYRDLVGKVLLICDKSFDNRSKNAEDDYDMHVFIKVSFRVCLLTLAVAHAQHQTEIPLNANKTVNELDIYSTTIITSIYFIQNVIEIWK